MHQLNACQSDRGVPEAFEAEHDALTESPSQIAPEPLLVGSSRQIFL
jgi:hypothetical protein